MDIESFIEELCENKDKPELQCNGKCYLSKMTETTSSQEEQSIPVLEWEQLVFCQIELIVETQRQVLIRKHTDFYYFRASSEDHSHSIFHPPKSS